MTNTLNKERMKEIKYDLDGTTCITPCPYFANYDGRTIGSWMCNLCEYCRGDNEIDNIVSCAYGEREDVAVGIENPVNHPVHYNQGSIECIDAIQAARGDEATKEFCICNAIKYLWRLGHKDEPVQEAKKAIWYINKYIELSEKK